MCAIKVLGRFTVRDSRILAITALVFMTGAVWIISQNTESLLGVMGRDLTFSGRTDIWRAVLEAISRRPLLGYGYAAFWRGMQGESASVIMAVRWAVPHAHNAFLEVWLQLGLLGMSCLLVTLGMAIRDFSVCFRPERPRAVDWYMGLLIIIVLYGLAEPVLIAERSLTWVLYITACVGLRRSALAICRRQTHTARPSTEPNAQ
jgi:O-antigen ligase